MTIETDSVAYLEALARIANSEPVKTACQPQVQYPREITGSEVQRVLLARFILEKTGKE